MDKTLSRLSSWRKTLDKGSTKRNSFAGAGVAAGQNVPAGESFGNGGRLDGKRSVCSHCREDIDKGSSDAEVEEAFCLVASSGDGNSRVPLADDIVTFGLAARTRSSMAATRWA